MIAAQVHPNITDFFFVVGLAYQGKGFVFTFIIEYSSLRDFGSLVLDIFLYENFLKDDILATVET
jgi:hypothetical protein